MDNKKIKWLNRQTTEEADLTDEGTEWSSWQTIVDTSGDGNGNDNVAEEASQVIKHVQL